ncbi:MAG: DUF1833 domain-containing protein [Alphaproteobacteria bacterium]|nr:MAG: DUF1833 domain-containing protein [Alphaproteobacteria bacterium]
MTLDNNGLQAAFAESTDAVWLVYLLIDHPDIEDGPLRIVRNSADVVRDGQTYRGLMFDISLPGQHERMAGIARISLPNVDRLITDAVRPLAASDTSVEVVIDVALAAAPGDIQHGPWHLVLRNVSWTAEAVTGDLYPVVELDQAWPEAKMDNARFPGLFPG